MRTGYSCSRCGEEIQLNARKLRLAREVYFAILLDRATAAPLIVASTEGGVEIETVAVKSPEKIIRESIDPLAGLQPFQTRKLAKQLQFDSSQPKAASKLFDRIVPDLHICWNLWTPRNSRFLATSGLQ